MLLHTANELEATQKLGAAMGKSALYQKRGELRATVAARPMRRLADGAQQVAPDARRRADAAEAAPWMRGGGLSPLAVLGHFGDDLSAPDGKWAAIGGSLFFDARPGLRAASRPARTADGWSTSTA